MEALAPGRAETRAELLPALGWGGLLSKDRRSMGEIMCWGGGMQERLHLAGCGGHHVDVACPLPTILPSTSALTHLGLKLPLLLLSGQAGWGWAGATTSEGKHQRGVCAESG